MSDHDLPSIPPPPPPPVPMPAPPVLFTACVLCGVARSGPGERCQECGLHPGLSGGDPDSLGRPGVALILGSLAAIYLVVLGIVAATN
jgi:hypothetical protein